MDPKRMEELRAALSEAINPAHRDRVASICRSLLVALGAASASASASAPPAAPPPAAATPPPLPLPPGIERWLAALRLELDRRGGDEANIPFVAFATD